MEYAQIYFVYVVCKFVDLNAVTTELIRDDIHHNASNLILNIDIPDNTSALEESKTIVIHLSIEECKDPLVKQKQKLLDHFMQYIDGGKTQQHI